MSNSRPFNPATDSFIINGTPENPCLTNFFKASLFTFILNNESAVSFEVDKVSISGNIHFVLKGINDQGQITGSKVGELPCPEHCLPGQPILPHRFDRDHLEIVLCNSPVIEYLTVHRCRVNNTSESFAIYAHTGTVALRNPALGHKIYVAN